MLFSLDSPRHRRIAPLPTRRLFALRYEASVLLVCVGVKSSEAYCHYKFLASISDFGVRTEELQNSSKVFRVGVAEMR
ncbi:hypothetical protein B0H10DRAFT_2087313 [Mycena sp. CBHHK59/15]|nr:hypothetical protein B0H10DRAFT_2087313 [Mycena sp. CBHHK59/15]